MTSKTLPYEESPIIVGKTFYLLMHISKFIYGENRLPQESVMYSTPYSLELIIVLHHHHCGSVNLHIFCAQFILMKLQNSVD